MHLLTNSTLTKKDLDLAVDVIKSEKITKGKYTDSVEKKFKKMFSRYCLFVNSGFFIGNYSYKINKNTAKKIIKKIEFEISKYE